MINDLLQYNNDMYNTINSYKLNKEQNNMLLLIKISLESFIKHHDDSNEEILLRVEKHILTKYNWFINKYNIKIE